MLSKFSFDMPFPVSLMSIAIHCLELPSVMASSFLSSGVSSMASMEFLMML